MQERGWRLQHSMRPQRHRLVQNSWRDRAGNIGERCAAVVDHGGATTDNNNPKRQGIQENESARRADVNKLNEGI
jgi:hypothetical protein